MAINFVSPWMSPNHPHPRTPAGGPRIKALDMRNFTGLTGGPGCLPETLQCQTHPRKKLFLPGRPPVPGAERGEPGGMEEGSGPSPPSIP